VSTVPRETDDELREWIADWQTEPEPAPEVRDNIRRRVKRQTLKMALSLAGEVVLTAGLLAIVIRSAVLWPEPLNLAAMAGLAMLIFWAIGSSLWYRRGTWRPSAETASAFLDLSILRCRRRLAALRAGWFLLALEEAILIPWLCLLLNGKPVSRYVGGFGFLVLMTALIVGFSLTAQWRTRRELGELEAARRSLGKG
jgi:hypothetical protein